ncbi:hypothetical protein D9615_008230 [Tricholomella constricta]|uniref:Oxidoreductase AflY n=1 Tax=Tricholomella constricta TaxID=117010 RepID=A0A8H5LZK8_9AGAR|nr:hypothetical protein D9615_008230 [Tricholomella constricta]
MLPSLRRPISRPIRVRPSATHVSHLHPLHQTMSTNITDLFPIPSSPPYKLIPKPWPGISPESTTALREVLKDNHTRWDIFFNDSGFHNHSSHRAIANWALGAAGDLIKAGYEEDSKTQRPARDPPEPITTKNFKEHLGNRSYYGGYLAFFTDVISEQGVASAVERYIFAKDMNIDPSAKKKPDVFNRFLGGLIHPMIHTGYGLEFCLPGMVAEGLAEAAVHSDESSARIPDDFFHYGGKAKGVEDTLSRLKSLLITSHEPSAKLSTTNGVHAFTVLKRVLDDPELGKVEDTESGMFQRTMIDHAAVLAKHMSDWHVDGTNPRDVARKIEELSWTNAMIYGVGGWAKDKHFNADFFHMHLVTSSIFLAAYAAYLTPSSQEHLLRGYFLVSLGWWVSRGRPNLDIKGFYETTSAHPKPSGALPTPNKKALSPSDPAKVVNPNAWLPVIETCVVHADDHLPKLQRALAHYASLYGTREAGEADFEATELPGAELLDGTLFIRAAGLTATRMGRVREGEEPADFWDRNGFYKA